MNIIGLASLSGRQRGDKEQMKPGGKERVEGYRRVAVWGVVRIGENGVVAFRGLSCCRSGMLHVGGWGARARSIDGTHGLFFLG